MQSYTTQAHQRNYQGQVVLNQPVKVKRRRITSIAIAVLVVALAVTTGLLGVSTLHNQQLKQRLQTANAQVSTVDAPTETTPTHRRGKVLPRIPVSERSHATENLPSVN